MGKNYYSYSKISCYNTCPLQYYLQYVQKVKLPKIYSYDVMKGQIFHYYAEIYKGDRREALADAFTAHEDVSQEFIDKLTKDEKQLITDKCRLYDELWKNKFKNENVQHEFKLQIDEKYVFTGYIDVLLAHSDGTYTILDFKTAKTINASLYADQIRTYAYFLNKQKGIPINKIKGAVFFPFASTSFPGENWQDVTVTEANVKKTITKFEETIEKIETGEINKEPVLNFLCQWCSFKGRTEYCPISVIAGLKAPLEISSKA